MANLTPNEYFKIEGGIPIRSSRLRFQETASFDDKTLKDIPASVDFVGQNDRVIFLSMNKKGDVRLMTFKILNKEGTTAKPDDVIDSIKNDSDFPGVDITDYVKKILGRKYEDLLTEDPTKADQFIENHVQKSLNVQKAYFVEKIEIIQTPWDTNVVPTQPTGPSTPPVENKTVTTTEPMVATSSVGASASNVDDSNVGASASNVGATASILGEFTFNVEQDNTFIGVNNQFGTLYTIGIGEIKEEPLDIPEEGELLPEEGLDEEYQEETYVESSDNLITDDIIRNVDQTEPPVVYGPVTNNESATSTVVGSTNNLKPTKKGYLQGSTFKNTIQSGGWNQKVDTKYVLTGFKFGKPTITEKTFVARVKKAEGGIFNDTADNAYKTYGMNTVCPISKNDKAYNKKYASLCTTGKNRLYNIHTNKGITYIVFKAAFGIKKDQDGSIDVQERYLKMSDDDWWKVMKGLYYDPNKGGQIKSKIASYFWVYMCWGSGSAGAVGNLNNALNMLKGSTVFKGGISNSHINYMNELYDQGKEDTLISAMYDARIQKLLNISQPDNTNKKYRNGWVNGINNWITDFHES